VTPHFITLRPIRSSRSSRSDRSPRSHWSVADLPSLAGRRALVTGATQGIGFEVALALAGAGADVMLAGRSRADLDAAAAAIVRRHPGARVSGEVLDLARFESVRTFADRVGADGRALDVLVNNAGIMAIKPRRVTEDGFEAQFQVNYLAHFLLTALLLPLLRAARAPRVTHVSSSVYHAGRIAFDDLQSAHAYSPFRAYAQSKLANLLFTFELQRRSDALGWGLVSTAAHPGIARTNLVENNRGRDFLYLGKRALGTWLTQSSERGALPTIYAAASPGAAPMGYYGPAYLFELKGPVAPARISARATNVADARRLWEISSTMADARFPE
jgi:NAD(P)-dependent dehydrogenase (short-subunit alcohol dehydrogenase family)